MSVASLSPASGAPGAPTPPEHRRARRWRIMALVAPVLALALAVAACAPPASSGGGVTGDVLAAMNQDRGAAGVGPLAWDSQLADLAQRHAQELAASGVLVHTDLGSLIGMPSMAGWHSLGENLLMAPGATNGYQAEDLWMGSGPHRANIMNGAYNRVGVGAATDGSGREWMVALFGAR